MAIFEWDNSLSTGIQEIDDQHKKLIDLINNFYLETKQKKTGSSVLQAVVQMKNYTLFHFGTEEKYFDQYGYPETGAHLRQHAHFNRRVDNFEKRIEEGESVSSDEILNFLAEWFINHIRQSDKRYALFFIQNGIK